MLYMFLRSMNKDEKDKENQRKSSSPSKPRSSRPRTAPLSCPRKVAPQIFPPFKYIILVIL